MALPFVLPVSNSSKVFLPSPYSLIIATPFLYASNDPLMERNTFSIITQLSNHHLAGILAFWFVVTFFLLLYIKRKYGYIRYLPNKSKSSLFICLLIIPLLFGCAKPGLEERDELTINFSNDLLYSYSDPYVVSLFPTLMLEDTSNASLSQINRDPFLNKEFVDKHVGGIFIDNDVLFYSITTNDYGQIRSVNLSNWDDQELYTRYPQQQVSIINDDLEIHTWSQGKSFYPL